MATDSFPLQTLIDLAHTEVDEAARELGRRNNQRETAERQLHMLRDYRQDYLEKLQVAMQTGLSAADCHNYQRFITTLDDALAQQTGVLQHAEQQVLAGRACWQQAQRKLNSFEALHQRKAQAQARINVRREQRVNDEHCARLFHRRAQPSFC